MKLCVSEQLPVYDRPMVYYAFVAPMRMGYTTYYGSLAFASCSPIACGRRSALDRCASIRALGSRHRSEAGEVRIARCRHRPLLTIGKSSRPWFGARPVPRLRLVPLLRCLTHDEPGPGHIAKDARPADEISACEAPRVVQEAVEPFEAELLNPGRRACFNPGDVVD